MYYTAKATKDDDPLLAIGKFKKITEMELKDSEVEWQFRCYKQLIKLSFSEGDYDAALSWLKHVLSLAPNLSQGYLEESLSRMISRYSNISNADFIEQFYKTILEQKEYINDRVWLKIKSNQLSSLIDSGINDKYHIGKSGIDSVESLLREIQTKLLHVPDATRKLFNLEIIAAEMEFLFQTKTLDLFRMNRLYKQSLKSTTAVTHPKIVGIIKECGAKVHFFRQDYERAKYEFYQSFKSYDEAGGSTNEKKNKNLKYLALCSLLTDDELDPFQSQETQTFALNNPDFDNLKSLIHAYHSLSIHELQLVLNNDPLFRTDDIFVHAAMQLQKNLRLNLLLKLIAEADQLTFVDLIATLDLDSFSDLEDLLSKLVSRGQLKDVKIDYVKGIIFSKDVCTNLLRPTSARSIYYNIKFIDSLWGRDQLRVTKAGTESRTESGSGFGSGLETESGSGLETGLESGLESGLEGSVEPTDEMMQVDSNPSLLFATGELAGSFTSSSLANKLFFLIDRPQSPPDWFPAIEKWYTYVMSALPKPYKVQMSHNEQVVQEQQKFIADSNAAKASASAAAAAARGQELANFNTGLLSSTIGGVGENVGGGVGTGAGTGTGTGTRDDGFFTGNSGSGDNIDDEDESEITLVKRVDLLKTWVQTLTS